jgi:glycosyltransferase involved in cell wall biosynthesis
MRGRADAGERAALRVALVSPGYPPETGGVESYVAHLAGALVRLGHQPTVHTQAGGDVIAELGADAVEQGVRVVRHRSPVKNLRDIPPPGVMTAVRRHRAELDVVHAHSYHQLPALGAALFTGSAPLVANLHYHGVGHTRLRSLLHRPYRPAGRLLVRRAGALIANSTGEAELIRASFGSRAAARTVLIPPGVDPAPAAAPFEVPGRVVLAVGRLEPYKRVDRLVATVPELPGDVRLVVVGDGPARSDLARLAARLGVSGRVSLLGSIPGGELERWHATAAVYATASDHESFGLALADALSAGIPCVASAIPAHADVAALGGVAVDFVRVPDRSAWVAALRSALARPRAGGARFPAWDEVASRVVAVYRRCLQARGAR